jgi:hypothetical protein
MNPTAATENHCRHSCWIRSVRDRSGGRLAGRTGKAGGVCGRMVGVGVARMNDEMPLGVGRVAEVGGASPSRVGDGTMVASGVGEGNGAGSGDGNFDASGKVG